MFKTTIMVNKRDKNLLYYFYFRQTAILFLYSFNFTPFLLHFSSFSLFFVLILSYLSGTCTFFFCRHIWAELSLLFWTFLSGTFFPGGGGGGARAPSAPPLRTRLSAQSNRECRIPFLQLDPISFRVTERLWKDLNPNGVRVEFDRLEIV